MARICLAASRDGRTARVENKMAAAVVAQVLAEERQRATGAVGAAPAPVVVGGLLETPVAQSIPPPTFMPSAPAVQPTPEPPAPSAEPAPASQSSGEDPTLSDLLDGVYPYNLVDVAGMTFEGLYAAAFPLGLSGGSNEGLRGGAAVPNLVSSRYQLSSTATAVGAATDVESSPLPAEPQYGLPGSHPASSCRTVNPAPRSAFTLALPNLPAKPPASLSSEPKNKVEDEEMVFNGHVEKKPRTSTPQPTSPATTSTASSIRPSIWNLALPTVRAPASQPSKRKAPVGDGEKEDSGETVESNNTLPDASEQHEDARQSKKRKTSDLAAASTASDALAHKLKPQAKKGKAKAKKQRSPTPREVSPPSHQTPQLTTARPRISQPRRTGHRQ